ncbi:MAG: UDP-N-acetylmuramate dehydrogenase [Patescibacteria group bacterium]
MLNLKNLQKNIVLAPYTTYKIGGKADYFFTANNKSDLVEALSCVKTENIPFFVLGGGSNILVGDKGFRGLVIHNQAQNFKFEDNLLISESGAIISDLIDISLKHCLSGLERFAGIPGTVGGAIYQNIHFLSPDRTSTFYIESIVKSGLVLEDGIEREVDKNYFAFGYDDSILHHNKNIFVLEITFTLKNGDPDLIQSWITNNLEWRKQKQERLEKFPSCGSVFKKIKGIGAGRLIEQCGLKGKRIGGALISEKHANYIVNTGNATARDVREMIAFIQEEVFKKTGYKLESEVGFIGEF